MSIRIAALIEREIMRPDLAERLERLGKEMLALAAEVKATASVGADIPPEAKLRQIELTQGALELMASLLPKEEAQDDDADCEAAIALVRTTRQASVSHF